MGGSDLARLEELLVRSVHSDGEADRFFLSRLDDAALARDLLEIAEESESGDARMAGAYWISQCAPSLLRPLEGRLLGLMDCGWDSVAVHAMMALANIRSRAALEKIIDEKIRPCLYWEAAALRCYLPPAEEQEEPL